MPTRKTRDELDAEMQTASEPGRTDTQTEARPQQVAIPPPDADAPQGQEPGFAKPEEAPAIQAGSPPKAHPPKIPSGLVGLIESLLFAAGEPISVQTLMGVLADYPSDLSTQEIRQAVERLQVELREQGRGVRVAEVAGGFQMRTPSEVAPYLRKLVSRRPPRLTRATLECLAIVAYRQPVTRGDVEEIRGVESGAVLRHLLEKKLIRILGRKEEPGRPLLYGTTKEFLAFFSLKDLSSLPTLREYAGLSDEHRTSLGLEPTSLEAQTEAEPTAERLQTDFTDAYAPLGHDEVVQDLAEALTELRRRDRSLRKVLPKEDPSEPGPDRPGESAAQGSGEETGTGKGSASDGPNPAADAANAENRDAAGGGPAGKDEGG